MIDEASAARADAVVALGARFVAEGDPLADAWHRALTATSPLSSEGILLAMRHLETTQSAAERERFHAHVRSAPRAHLVLSGNVCTAALRAIALAVASAPEVFVKASRRDPDLARLLVDELAASPRFEGRIASVDAIATRPGDRVFAYGSDETLASIRSALPAGVDFVGHGHGIGIGWVGSGEHATFDADALARDVIVFDQAGCLSPRVVFADGTEEEVLGIGRRLADALAAAHRVVPRGEVDLGASSLYTRAVGSTGELFEGEGYAVGVDLAPEALTIPPPARMLHLVRAGAAHAVSLLRPMSRFITTIGTTDGGSRSSELHTTFAALCAGARMTRFGAMQRPPLDGPVDLRAD